MAEASTRITHTCAVKGRDLTRGGLHRAIWHLAPPMMLETGILNVAQVLDTYWVGQLGSAALAAVTISITLRWVLNSMANGLGVAGMAVVARRIGARDQAAAEHAAGQTLLLGFGLSLLLGGLGLAAAKPLLSLLGADAQVLALGLAYLRVAFGGVLTLVLSTAMHKFAPTISDGDEVYLGQEVRDARTKAQVSNRINNRRRTRTAKGGKLPHRFAREGNTGTHSSGSTRSSGMEQSADSRGDRLQTPQCSEMA
jgi:hypothetical protein